MWAVKDKQLSWLGVCEDSVALLQQLELSDLDTETFNGVALSLLPR